MELTKTLHPQNPAVDPPSGDPTPKPVPSFHHPPYAKMIMVAIAELKEKNGSSRRAIDKYIETRYQNLPWTHSALLTRSLKRLKKSGQIVMVKRSYKIPSSAPLRRQIRANPGSRPSNVGETPNSGALAASPAPAAPAADAVVPGPVTGATLVAPLPPAEGGVLQRQNGKNSSSQSDSPTVEDQVHTSSKSSSSSSSSGESSSYLNLWENHAEYTITGRASWVKDELAKRLKEGNMKLIEAVRAETRQLIEVLKARTEQQMTHNKNAWRKLAMMEYREENRTLLKNLSSIKDPVQRELIRREQETIWQKRKQQPGICS